MDGTVTDEEFAELTQLSCAKKQLRDARSGLIAQLQQSVQTQHIAMLELFSEQEVAAAAATIRLPAQSVSVAPAVVLKPSKPKPVESASDISATGTWVRQKRGLVLVEIKKPGVQGLPCRYCKGQTMAFYVPPALKALDDGNLEANLERHTTDAGRAYFATADGQAEWAQLVQYIRTGKLKRVSEGA